MVLSSSGARLWAWGHGNWSPPSFGSHLNPIPNWGTDYAHQILMFPPSFKSHRLLLKFLPMPLIFILVKKKGQGKIFTKNGEHWYKTSTYVKKSNADLHSPPQKIFNSRYTILYFVHTFHFFYEQKLKYWSKTKQLSPFGNDIGNSFNHNSTTTYKKCKLERFHNRRSHLFFQLEFGLPSFCDKLVDKISAQPIYLIYQVDLIFF